MIKKNDNTMTPSTNKNQKVATRSPHSQSKNQPGKIDFMKMAKFFVPFSILGTLLSFVLIFSKDFKYGVDFSGGTEIQVLFKKPVEGGRVRKFMSDVGHENASIQAFEKGNEYLVRIEPIKASSEKQANLLLNESIKKITDGFNTSFHEEGISIERVDTVGPQVGSELKRNGILAAFYSLLMILIYIGLRFDYKYAPGAVFCLFHDALMILGVYALFQWEMNVQIMAAILTIIGYSLNDTIVVFDRIRENEKLYHGESFRWICNRSMNDVFVRSLLTSLTTFISVVVMWLLAGGVIKDFALTMAIGIIFGTYSSIYVATPLVIFVDNLEKNKSKV
ncbi:MAG: protein translocase subunit SecF [Bdellovibrionales bacterium]|nr:protein translocase subunit SecF [Bdellovibrionales bacterium]